ncbi:hypothetical protein GS506_03060 [Rhodococcus hoagii]|nr:hypothetical protein [Prescottella equi]
MSIVPVLAAKSPGHGRPAVSGTPGSPIVQQLFPGNGCAGPHHPWSTWVSLRGGRMAHRQSARAHRQLVPTDVRGNHTSGLFRCTSFPSPEHPGSLCRVGARSPAGTSVGYCCSTRRSNP